MLNAEKFRDELLNDKHSTIYNVFYVHERETGIMARDYETVYRWLLSGYKELILDKVEREYLSKVCEPYEVVAIRKYISLCSDCEYINISVKYYDIDGINYINLPYFKANTMYKGMELEKDYTPQELGIKCKNNPNGEIKHG